jgi:hypothetical protein
MQLKEIVKRHELTEKYFPTLEPKPALAEAHQDRAYLLGVVEETAMFLKGIKEDLEHMCIKDTCKAEEEIGAFLSKLESEADNDKSQTE